MVQAPEEQITEATPKRAIYLRLTPGRLLLFNLWMLLHQCMWWEIPSAVHVAMDAARAGGRDAEMGVIYHTASNAAAWLPPVGSTRGGGG